jgi:aminopeptidase N
LEYVASDSAEAFSFFLERFGPPATSKIVISPIPGGIGQGFPGLVYASTLSYFRPDDPPLAGRPAKERLFYSQLMRSHEISHQWWGNVVAPEDTADEWLMEALATYSSLLFLEERQGRDGLDRVLATYTADLLARDADGETVENAGAIVLGERLRSSSAPEASRVIVYEKGAWIMHMLRGVMGDDSFFGFLKALCDEFRFKPIGTEEFRRQAARFVPEGTSDRDLHEFFDQWVYGTGIPTLKLDYDVTSAGREFLVTGRLGQSDVAESSSLLVTIEAHAADGPQHRQVIATDGNVTEFTFKVGKEPTEIRLDPQKLILMNP